MYTKRIFPSHKPSVIYPNNRLFLTFLLFAAAAIPVNFIYYYSERYGVSGLPFDDAFIHLTFAKNLSEYLAFSFFKDEMVTSGSSSPLFTFILALGKFFFTNEFLLSYVAGIFPFILSITVFFRLNQLDYKTNYRYLIASVLIFALDKKLAYFSVSGMETILFVFNLLLSLYFYRTRKVLPLAVSLALGIWIRPEAILFIVAVMIDYSLFIFHFKNNLKTDDRKLTKNNFKIIFFIMSLSFLLYASFNFSLSGTIFPNTFYAKGVFYSPEFMSRDFFLKNDVWGFFTTGSYTFFMSGFIISLIKFGYDLFKRRVNNNFLYFVFIAIFISVYWFRMPYSGLNGRYLVPLIPFFLMISISGFTFLLNIFNRYFYAGAYINFAKYAIWLICVYIISTDLSLERELFAKDCRENQITHIDAANWIRENTHPDDVIATHEIGAIGFYSNRKIVDIAGLVTPELIDELPDENYISIMQDFLKAKDVKYFAAMRSWCRVDNANPLFASGKNEHSSDVLEIFRYTPGETHLLSKQTNKLLTLAQFNLSKNHVAPALYFLEEAISSDPESSLNYFFLADAYRRIGDIVNSEKNLLKAIKIFPDYPEANFQLSMLYKSKDDSVNSTECFNRYKKTINRMYSSYKTISGKIPLKDLK